MLKSVESVRWAELTPLQFQIRRSAFPLAYLPLGLCEPHGPETPLGLDLIKAESLCLAAARMYGGVVAPALGFHIHECGPSAHWLLEQVGETEPHLSSVGPAALSHFLVHQLRAAANASFAAGLVVSGHAGAHAVDLARLVDSFAAAFGFPCLYLTDFELARPEYQPDHAGKYELSLILHLRPDLMDCAPAKPGDKLPPNERFALASSAAEADRREGRMIFDLLVEKLGGRARAIVGRREPVSRRITFEQADSFWKSHATTFAKWACLHPRDDQPPIPLASRWKTEEHASWP